MRKAVKEEYEKSPIKEKLNPETIRSKIRYEPVPSKKPGGKQKLGKEIETFLVALIIAFSTNLMSLTKSMLQGIANLLWPKQAPFGKKWYKLFMKRHGKSIKARIGKKSHKRKVLLGAFSSISNWCKTMETIWKKEAWQRHLVFNIDETKALPSSLRQQLLATSNMTEAQYQLVQDSTLYSMVSCISADGTTLFVLYIFRKVQSKTSTDQPIFTPEHVGDSKATRSKNSYPIFFATTPKGYMNGELWKEVLKKFTELAGQRQGIGKKQPVLLYIDGCSSHLKSETPDILSKHNITTVWFPSNTSHILQPADGAYFATYKNALQETIAHANIVELLSGDPLKKTSLLCSIEALRKASEVDVVKASFERRGMFPFDEALILANATQAIGTERSMDASQDLLNQLLTDVMFNNLKAYFATTKPTLKRHISDTNKVFSAEELPTKAAPKLPSASRAKKTAKATAAAPIESPVISESENEESDGELDLSSDEEEVQVWDLQPLPTHLPPSATDLELISCPGCGLQKESRHVLIACFNCNALRACTRCRMDGKALTKHQKETNCGKSGRPKRAGRSGK